MIKSNLICKLNSTVLFDVKGFMIQTIDQRLKIRIYSSNTSIGLTTTWRCVKLGGQVVMRRAIVAAAALLFCQNLGGQLPTLPTHPYTRFDQTKIG